MPNHVINRLYFPKKIRKKMVETIIIEEDNKKLVDFDKIISMPEALNIVSGTSTDDGISLYLTLVNPNAPYLGEHKMDEEEFRNLVSKINKNRMFGYRFCLRQQEIQELKEQYEIRGENFDEIIELGKKAVENFIKYGATTWYDWRCENWGTKWNAYETIITKEYIEFQTAWSSPNPILKKLSQMFPDIPLFVMVNSEGSYDTWIDRYLNGVQSEVTDKEKKILSYTLRGWLDYGIIKDMFEEEEDE